MRVFLRLTGHVFIIGALLSFSSALGMEKQIAKGGFGFKAGLINSTSFVINDIEYESNTGLATGVYFDLPFIRKSKVVIALDFYDIHVLDDKQWMIDLSLGFRPTFRKAGSDVALKPGIAIGYSHLALIGDLNTTNYLTFKSGVEIMYHTGRKYVHTFEIFFLATRYGGNRTVEISHNPVLVVRLGVLY